MYIHINMVDAIVARLSALCCWGRVAVIVSSGPFASRRSASHQMRANSNHIAEIGAANGTSRASYSGHQRKE